MEENKWYEKLKNQCKKCKQYDGVRFINEVKGFYVFNCRFCGDIKKRPVIKGSWEMKNGAHFLNGVEMEISRNSKGEIYIHRVVGGQDFSGAGAVDIFIMRLLKGVIE